METRVEIGVTLHDTSISKLRFTCSCRERVFVTKCKFYRTRDVQRNVGRGDDTVCAWAENRCQGRFRRWKWIKPRPGGGDIQHRVVVLITALGHLRTIINRLNSHEDGRLLSPYAYLDELTACSTRASYVSVGSSPKSTKEYYTCLVDEGRNLSDTTTLALPNRVSMYSSPTPTGRTEHKVDFTTSTSFSVVR